MEPFVTLKLDATYRPIDVIEAVEALVMCIIGKAKVVEEHSTTISSTKRVFKLPAVIALNRVMKFRLVTSRPTRQNIYTRDANHCQYCGNVFAVEDLTLDHVFPKSRGGKNTWKNLVTCCKKCNQRKGNRTPEESGIHLIEAPYEPKGLGYRFKSYSQELWKDYLWY